MLSLVSLTRPASRFGHLSSHGLSSSCSSLKCLAARPLVSRANAHGMLSRVHPITRGPSIEEAIEGAVRRCQEQALQEDVSRARAHLEREGIRLVQSDRNWSRRMQQAVTSWIIEASEQGSSDAQFHLAVCMWKGHGICHDTSLACAFYARAAEQHHMLAQYNLGVCYLHGRGTDPKDAEAASMFLLAAKAGVKQAQYAMGACYFLGVGVERDLKQAAYWLAQAAQQGFDPTRLPVESSSRGTIVPRRDFKSTNPRQLCQPHVKRRRGPQSLTPGMKLAIERRKQMRRQKMDEKLAAGKL